MAIPKIIYQTYRNEKLPAITRFFVWWTKKVNKDYRYEFYDHNRITYFLKNEFPPEVYDAYKKLGIGAAKGDFFRYAVLYKTGGVYVDIDGAILRSLSNIILPNDVALISKETNGIHYVQWALIFDKNHPFLERTLSKCIDNINTNRYPNDVHKMTGPSVYTKAVQECLKENPTIPHRLWSVEYNRKIKSVLIPKHFLNKLIYLRRGHERWAKEQTKKGVLNS